MLRKPVKNLSLENVAFWQQPRVAIKQRSCTGKTTYAGNMVSFAMFIILPNGVSV